MNNRDRKFLTVMIMLGGRKMPPGYRHKIRDLGFESIEGICSIHRRLVIRMGKEHKGEDTLEFINKISEEKEVDWSKAIVRASEMVGWEVPVA